MSPLAPLLAIKSREDSGVGFVPPDLLVQFAADAGFSAVALVDDCTLRAAPRFLHACRKFRITPLVGISAHLAPAVTESAPPPEDVFDWYDRNRRRHSARPQEPICLLAVHPKGFANLLALIQKRKRGGAHAYAVKDLITHSEGLYLLLGAPGSCLRPRPERITAHSVPSEIRNLVEGWPRERLGYAGLKLGDGGADIPHQADRIHRLGINAKPVAVVWGGYRNAAERFYGGARALGSGKLRPGLLPDVIPSAGDFLGAFQGFPTPLRSVEWLTQRAEKALPALRLSYPTYPSPRGTDVASFFWSLGQESAISTGHIRMEGAKERLMEEFQFLKQTPWPGVWLTLWDVRRRLGLPPGTLRPTASWIGTSLFAHLLGLVRIDPFRERMGFAPQPPFSPPDESLAVDIEGPEGFEHDLLEALQSLFGPRHAARIASPRRLAENRLRDSAPALQQQWTEFELEGDPPTTLPPIPAYSTTSSPESANPGPVRSYVISGTPTALLFPSSEQGTLDLSQDDLHLLGSWHFRLSTTPQQTLTAAPSYRGIAKVVGRSSGGLETLSDWIEGHRGKPFAERGYADDAGRLEVLALSSSLLRLFTLPGSAGYRPLLWQWIVSTRPTRVGELADLLALQWHWTYWNQRPEKRDLALARRHPLVSEEKAPPWWEDWQRFLEGGRLSPRLAGDLGAALERVSRGTGGWILYREQAAFALKDAFGVEFSVAESWVGEGARSEFAGPTDGAASRGREQENSEGTDSWDAGLRSQFLRFLGHPQPLPSRLEFLWKAEHLLNMSEAFAADPAASVVLLSLLMPDLVDERREIYALLRSRGINIALPRLETFCRFDRSPDRNTLQVGTFNLVGIGPHIAAALEDALDSADLHFSPRLLFQEPGPPPGDFETWLSRFEHSSLNRKVVRDLIDLDFFRGFGEQRRRLLSLCRLMKRDQASPSAVQSTLFPLAPSVVEPVGALDAPDTPEGTVHQELDLFRFGVRSTPLDLWAADLPEAWLTGDEASRPRDFLVGWVHEVEAFGGLPQGSLMDMGDQRFATYLLFTPVQAYRIIDEHGLILEYVAAQETIAPRRDGQRVLLRAPLSLLARVGPTSAPETSGVRTVRLLALEPIAEVVNAARGQLEVSLEVDSTILKHEDSLARILSWASGGTASVPVQITDESPLFRRGGVRRLIQRVGACQIPPSRLIREGLEGVPGVRQVRILGGGHPLLEQASPGANV